MVFIIQNTQNRDARAINLKLGELIHAIDTAKNQMMDIEKLSDEELDVITRNIRRCGPTVLTTKAKREPDLLAREILLNNLRHSINRRRLGHFLNLFIR
jgi:hypothetical protein